LLPADKSAERVQSFGGDTVMKRPAQPEAIAPAYVFLAAPTMSSCNRRSSGRHFSVAAI